MRKQQKRNDVDAFRKMQQLRKEFTTAKNLLQLILERELLREVHISFSMHLFCYISPIYAHVQAEFDIQREVFAQRLHDAGIASVYEQTPETSGDADTAMLVDDSTAVETDNVSGKPLRRAAPFKHELRFEDLVYLPVSVVHSACCENV